jgi:SMODS-associating 2TM, beta-strand rich effector domain
VPSPTWTRIVVGLVALLVVVIVVVTGQSIDENGYKWISGIAAGITLGLLAYDRWVWRWPLIRKLAEWTGTPVLHGTWKGTLDYEADADGNPGSIDFYMTVQQTYSEVEIHSYVSTSESHSMASKLERPSRGQRLLWFIYRSEAPVLGQQTNRPHHGGTKLVLVGSPVHEIHGSYWTDRRGRGELRFDEYSKKAYGSFSEALAGSYTRR